MKKNKIKILSAVMLLVIITLPFFALAQDPGGGPDAPIDGGLSVLLAAGVAYGAKKYRDSKKNEEKI